MEASELIRKGLEAGADFDSYTFGGAPVPLESYSQDELLSLMSYLSSFLGTRQRYLFLKDREVLLGASGFLPQKWVVKGLRMPFDRLPLCIGAQLRTFRGVVMWRLSKLGR